MKFQQAFVGMAAVFAAGCHGFDSVDVTDRWPEFHRDVVAPFVTLPPETRIKSASVIRTTGLWYHGPEGFSVVFELPESRPVVEWIEKIAGDSSIGDLREAESLDGSRQWFGKNAWGVSYTPFDRGRSPRNQEATYSLHGPLHGEMAARYGGS